MKRVADAAAGRRSPTSERLGHGRPSGLERDAGIGVDDRAPVARHPAREALPTAMRAVQQLVRADARRG